MNSPAPDSAPETYVLGIDCGDSNLAMVVLSTKDPSMPIAMKHINLNQRYHIKGKKIDRLRYFEIIDDLFQDLEREQLLSRISLVVVENQMQQRFTLQMYAILARVHYLHPDKVGRVAYPTRVKKFMGIDSTGKHTANKSRMLGRVKQILNPRAAKKLATFPVGQSDLADAYSYALYGVMDYGNIIVHDPRGIDAIDMHTRAKDRLDKMRLAMAAGQVRFDQYNAFRALKTADAADVRTACKNATKLARKGIKRKTLNDIRDDIAGDELRAPRCHLRTDADLVEG